MDKCKYCNEEVKLVSTYVDCLYELDGCSCGGSLHIVVDDDNVDDDSLEFCSKYIEEEGGIDSEICKLILSHMKQMTIVQRRLVAIGRRWGLNCPAKQWGGLKDCSECIIENEDVE